MLSRLRAFLERFRVRVSTTSSYAAFTLVIALLLVPKAVGELFWAIPGVVRWIFLLVMLAYMTLFYPQFRIWRGIKLRRKSTTGAASAADKAAESAPELFERNLSRQVVRPPSQNARPDETPLDLDDMKPAKPSERLLQESPEIKLADWMDDKDDEPDDDFWSMMSEVSRKKTSDE